MKKLLKRIFPIVYLKRAFLIYNNLKISTFDKIFFQEQIIPNEFFIINRSKNPFLELNIDSTEFSDEIKSKLNRWENSSWKQDEYFIKYKEPGFIDPKSGWAITLNKKLIYPSLGFSRAPHVHKPAFLETYFKKKKIVKIEKIISLRDTGEENYFHFFNDVLAKLFFIEDQEIVLNDYTIVVANALYKKPYFQYFISTSYLGKFKWFVQDETTWVHFDEAVFCKPYTHTKKYLQKSVQLTLTKDNGVEDRRFFLTRSKSSLRFIENQIDIIPILNRYNFEIIDTSSLDFSEQVSLFKQCKYLVAIHGAGISNIIFREGRPLEVLEIVHPSPYLPFHYIMLCKLYNYNYGALLGYKGKSHDKGGFFVDPDSLKNELEKWFGE